MLLPVDQNTLVNGQWKQIDLLSFKYQPRCFLFRLKQRGKHGLVFDCYCYQLQTRKFYIKV